VDAVVDMLHDLFGSGLCAVYLHGSATVGGLRPESDIDLIAVIDRPVTADGRQRLLAGLSKASGRHPRKSGAPRCLELMVFERDRLAERAYPAWAEFVYGEWLRDAFEAGEQIMPAQDPEHTLVLAQARNRSVRLFGLEACDLLPEISGETIRLSMRDALSSLMAGLDGDERNVLLTLARMWHTALSGDFVTKDVAAASAMGRLPSREAAVMAAARESYLEGADVNWNERRHEARATAISLHRRVAALLPAQ
jgi:predicted nucleotidyltransferase